MTEEFSAATWKDFEELFQKNGGVWGGCWCTFYKVPRGSPWRAGPGNREKQKELLLRGRAHGVIVLDAGTPVGWCQFGPKDELPRIDGRKGYVSPKEDFWRVTCFFVDKAHRRKGVARTALSAALRSMETSGAKLVEAYPVESGRKKTSATLLWAGTPSLYSAFGFRKVRKLGRSSCVMQKRLGPSEEASGPAARKARFVSEPSNG
jgi:GNAT superfamily N-acetyltransferase